MDDGLPIDERAQRECSDLFKRTNSVEQKERTATGKFQDSSHEHHLQCGAICCQSTEPLRNSGSASPRRPLQNNHKRSVGCENSFLGGGGQPISLELTIHPMLQEGPEVVRWISQE